MTTKNEIPKFLDRRNQENQSEPPNERNRHMTEVNEANIELAKTEEPVVEEIAAEETAGALTLNNNVVTLSAFVNGRDISYEEFTKIGIFLAKADKGVRWLLGDWLSFGEGKFSDVLDQAISETGLARSTLEQYKWVASRFKPEDRSYGFPWEVYRKIAAIKDDTERATVLNNAVSNGYGLTEVVEEVNAITGNTTSESRNTESGQSNTKEQIDEIINNAIPADELTTQEQADLEAIVLTFYESSLDFKINFFKKVWREFTEELGV